ncbi:hypothetical protein HYT74_00350 [Candidatus Daviesbacteria bacterium]|nr:hypothetical protein [Candidatus Daviesbacteria bacterium]
MLNSFKVVSGNKILDYRLGENLDLGKIELFFSKNYYVKKLWNGGRHVLGILTKNSETYFLKLSTSEGISVITKNEYNWNDYFNKYFPSGFLYNVPKNYDSGFYKKKYFYLITEFFDGELLSFHLTDYISQVIELAELIQKMPYEEGDYRKRFIDKVNLWFADVPVGIRKKYKLELLLEIVEKGVGELIGYPRHGDFAPWHILNLREGRLGLIDGEHAKPNSVENYDICYFIQRVFSVLKNPLIAQDIYSRLLMRGYKKDKLKVVLAARAIGGFLDESLAAKPNYKFANNFKDWVI